MENLRNLDVGEVLDVGFQCFLNVEGTGPFRLKLP